MTVSDLFLFDPSQIRRKVRTRSACAENPTGAARAGALATRGTGAHAARDLGVGWKVSPSIEIRPGDTAVLADVAGPGVFRHFWLTTHRDHWRRMVLRMTWDGADAPAVEVPLGDFFCSGWGQFAQVTSQMVAVNPYGGFNSYWPMPFREGAQITLTNLDHVSAVVYYQLTWDETPVSPDAGYLHAQFRRSNPLRRGDVHVIAEGVQGTGQYVGTYLAWGAHSRGWWGEGELKWTLDAGEDDAAAGDGLTGVDIVSTGTEDYFGGAWNFDPGDGYLTFTTPYLGLPQVIRGDGNYECVQRFGMYRWHVPDPIRFATALHRVDIQALGWHRDGRYQPLADDIASTCWFYLDQPTAARPQVPGVDDLVV